MQIKIEPPLSLESGAEQSGATSNWPVNVAVVGKRLEWFAGLRTCAPLPP